MRIITPIFRIWFALHRFDNATALEYLEWISLPLQISTSLDGLKFGRSHPICRPTAATIRWLTGRQPGLFLSPVKFETRYDFLQVGGPFGSFRFPIRHRDFA